MASKRVRLNLQGRGDRFDDFSYANRKVLVRVDAGRKRLIKKFKQKGEAVPWACYRREVDEFDHEKVRLGIPESSTDAAARLEREKKSRRLWESDSTAAARLDLLDRTLDLLQPYTLDLLDSIPLEMVGCVLSLVLLRKEKSNSSPPHLRLR